MCGGGSYGYPLSGRAAGGGSKQRSGVKHAGSAGRRDAGQRGRGQQLAGGVQQRRDQHAGHGQCGNFDGIADSFAAAGLASDALVPGQSLLHDGLRIDWPDVPPGQPDNVLADGQQIAVSGTGSVLGVVGASAYGSSTGTFTIGYADGGSSTASVTLADWVDSRAADGAGRAAGQRRAGALLRLLP